MKSEVDLYHDEGDHKFRACLKCRTVFDSAWAGERVCARCKGSNAWRNGGSVDIRAPRTRSVRTGGS
jgi:hypothetical protein